MNIQTITVTNMDGTTSDWVQIETAPNEFTSMPKSIYDTLPSNSSIPQAGN
jgi:hypothetical protein